jgi:hypothetical protein
VISENGNIDVLSGPYEEIMLSISCETPLSLSIKGGWEQLTWRKMREEERNREWNRRTRDDGTDHDFLPECRLRLFPPLA